MRLLLIAVGIVLFSTAPAAAQWKIKLPKINSPKISSKISDEIKRVGNDISKTAKSIESATEPDADKEAAAKALQQAKADIEDLGQLAIDLNDERERVAEEKVALEKERDELEAAKELLESRERFFATGFYSSILAIGLAIAGFVLNLPTLKLDRKLKQLQIVEKERSLNLPTDPPE